MKIIFQSFTRRDLNLKRNDSNSKKEEKKQGFYSKKRKREGEIKIRVKF